MTSQDGRKAGWSADLRPSLTDRQELVWDLELTLENGPGVLLQMFQGSLEGDFLLMPGAVAVLKFMILLCPPLVPSNSFA